MTARDHGLPLDAGTRETISQLPTDTRETLETLMAEASRRQHMMLSQAIDDAIAIVPAPFRKRLRRMILG